jgi:hypothetical protein
MKRRSRAGHESPAALPTSVAGDRDPLAMLALLDPHEADRVRQRGYTGQAERSPSARRGGEPSDRKSSCSPDGPNRAGECGEATGNLPAPKPILVGPERQLSQSTGRSPLASPEGRAISPECAWLAGVSRGAQLSAARCRRAVRCSGVRRPWMSAIRPRRCPSRRPALQLRKAVPTALDRVVAFAASWSAFASA